MNTRLRTAMVLWAAQVSNIQALSWNSIVGSSRNSRLVSAALAQPPKWFRSPQQQRIQQQRHDSTIATYSRYSYFTSSQQRQRHSFTKLYADSEPSATTAALDCSTLTLNLTKHSFGDLEYVTTPSSFRVIFVLGGPGAGKGSQSELMKQHYPVVHLSVGELLRDELQRPASPYQTILNATLRVGQIVPVEISLSLLQDAMQRQYCRDCYFVVDGFPRNFDNLAGWIHIMSRTHDLVLVLVYTCPPDVLTRRILQRARDSHEQQRRADDNLESLQRRLRVFEQESWPVIRRLQDVATGWTVHSVAADRSLDEVWDETQRSLRPLIQNDVLRATAALLAAIQNNQKEEYQKVSNLDWGDEKHTSGHDILSSVSNVHVQVVHGKQVMVQYECNRNDTSETILGERKQQCVCEERQWTHMGALGWRNTHVTQTRLEQEEWIE